MSYGKNAKTGKFKPRFPLKYKGKIQDITWRSSWELKFMNWADSTTNVKYWHSEETVVPYISPVDGQYHRYYIDFKVWIQKSDGSLDTYLVEIKPESMCIPPKKRKKTKAYIDEVMRYGVNQAKWESANKYANSRGEKFIVLTEKHLGISR